MSKLQELIRELCPNGVEYKKLGEISIINRGVRVTRDMLSKEGTIPVYQNALTPLGYFEKSNRKKDTTYVISAGAAGQIGYSAIDFWAADDCFTFDDVNGIYSKYIYYFLQTKKSFIASNVRRGSIPRISRAVFSKLEIPVPPLEVQKEIVRILDNFTTLAAELQAELQARQEQYEYYRNKLLTFSNINEKGYASVTWMKMSEIGTFIRGKRFVRTDIVNEGVPCIHYGDMYTHYKLYATKSKGMLRSELASKMRYAQKDDVVIVAAGENKEDIGIGVAWLGNEPAAVHDACFIFRSDLYPQYVSHYLRSNYYHKQIVKYVSEGKICSISAKGLGNAIIPIPTYEEQVKIATLLNKFDSLTSDLSQGLPAEIAAVQEQYEYYRDKLLSFPKNKVSA